MVVTLNDIRGVLKKKYCGPTINSLLKTSILFKELHKIKKIEHRREKKMFNALAKKIHENAVKKGFWDSPRNDGELIALVHSELSEALECLRAGEKAYYYMKEKRKGKVVWKPVGVVSEYADVIIRVLDICGAYHYDIDKAIREKIAFNKTRPTRHGQRF